MVLSRYAAELCSQPDPRLQNLQSLIGKEPLIALISPLYAVCKKDLLYLENGGNPFFFYPPVSSRAGRYQCLSLPDTIRVYLKTQKRPKKC